MKKRIDITIDEDLIAWSKLYARRLRTTISRLVNEYLASLKEQEKNRRGK